MNNYVKFVRIHDPRSNVTKSMHLSSDPNYSALRRIAVFGIESKDPAIRIAAIGDWLRGNFTKSALQFFRVLICEIRPTGRHMEFEMLLTFSFLITLSVKSLYLSS